MSDRFIRPTSWPVSPSMDDRPDLFDTEAESFLGHFETWETEWETFIGQLEQACDNIETNAQLVTSAGNLLGNWSDQISGPATMPTQVYHSSKYWNLLNDIADISASEPGVSSDWAEATVAVSSQPWASLIQTITISETVSYIEIDYDNSKEYLIDFNDVEPSVTSVINLLVAFRDDTSNINVFRNVKMGFLKSSGYGIISGELYALPVTSGLNDTLQSRLVIDSVSARANGITTGTTDYLVDTFGLFDMSVIDDVTNLRFYFSSGNITSGEIKVYQRM